MDYPKKPFVAESTTWRSIVSWVGVPIAIVVLIAGLARYQGLI